MTPYFSNTVLKLTERLTESFRTFWRLIYPQFSHKPVPMAGNGLNLARL